MYNPKMCMKNMNRAFLTGFLKSMAENKDIVTNIRQWSKFHFGESNSSWVPDRVLLGKVVIAVA